MKKHILLLFLIFTGFLQAQTYPVNPTKFGKISLNTNGVSTSTTKINTQESDGQINYIDAMNLPVPTSVINAIKQKADLSTGLLKNGLISINADPTKFNISAGIGIISNFDDPENPVSTIISFPAFTGVTPAYLLTGNITYIAINSTPAVVMQATPFTDTQRRDLIILGAAIHSNLTNINVVNNISAPSNAIGNQLHDFMEAVGALNITGNKYTANGANLSLNKSAGTIFKFGVNFATNWKDPHVLSQSSGTALTFRYRTQNGTEGSDVTVINPALYDVGNVLTAVPNNKFSIQTVTMFQTGLTRIQYGQNVYDDLASAQAAIFTRDYNVEANIKENGITRAYIIVKNNATSLQNATDSRIIEAQKFGGVASGGVALTFANIVAALGYTPANDVNVIHSTGNETFSGLKSGTTNNAAAEVGFSFINNYNGGAGNAANAPIQYINNFNGIGLGGQNNGIGILNAWQNTGAGILNNYASSLGSTGHLLRTQYNLLTTGWIDYLGGYHAPSYENTVANKNNALLASGNTLPNPSHRTGMYLRGKQVYFYGDSYTLGFGATVPANRWTSILSNLLGATEVNLGVGGTTLMKRAPIDYMASPNMVDNIPTVPTKTTSIGMLVLAYGLNDLGQTATDYTVANFKTDYTTVMNGIIAKGWDASQILIIPPYYIGSAGYAHYATITGNPAPTLQRHLDFIDACREIAQTFGAMYFDLYQDQKKNDTTLFFDNIHANDAGNRAIAMLVANYLNTDLFANLANIGYIPKTTTLDYTSNSAIYQDSNTNIGIGATSMNITQPGKSVNISTTVTNGQANLQLTGNSTVNGTVLGAIYFGNNAATGQSNGSFYATRENSNNNYSDFHFDVRGSGGYISNAFRIASTGALSMSVTPATSAGTYDILTRNTSTGVIEKVASSLLTGALLTTTDQSFTGVKSATNTGTSVTNGLTLTNSGTTGSRVLNGASTSSGDFMRIDVSSSGRAIFVNNSSSTSAISVSNISGSTGSSFVANAEPTATGNLYEGKNNSVTTFYVNKLGLVSGASFVATNGTVRLKNYTVATLPTGTQGDTAYVTDALSPTYLTTVVGGGAIVTPVFFDGTSWKCH